MTQPFDKLKLKIYYQCVDEAKMTTTNCLTFKIHT